MKEKNIYKSAYNEQRDMLTNRAFMILHDFPPDDSYLIIDYYSQLD